MQYNPTRLTLARSRRKLTKKQFADLVGVSSKTISIYESDSPDFTLQDDTIEKFAVALNYPVTFFYKNEVDVITGDTISYRAISKLSAPLKASSEAMSSIVYELSSWIDKRFNLPKLNLPDYSSHGNNLTPEAASQSLRQQWGIGSLSIRNIIHTLEKNGIKVFSLAEDCKDVDAFSFWKGEKAFVVLNQFKSPERSRFDAAHELGHLILHKHGIQQTGKEAEREADAFASAFLMPEASIAAKVNKNGLVSLNELIKLKKHWNVSLMALIRRLYDLNYISEWQYRQATINASKKGYRTHEPESIGEMEQSLILKKVFDSIRASGQKRIELIEDLALPLDELQSLTFNHPLFMPIISNQNVKNSTSKAKLTLV